MNLKRRVHVLPALLGGVVLPVALLLWSAQGNPLSSVVRVRGGTQVSLLITNQPIPQALEDTAISPTHIVCTTNDSDVAAARTTNTAAHENAGDSAGILDGTREFALGMIETGNDDSAVGRLGEVSRFQIMPSLWKHFSTSRSYQNPDAAAEVARQHWSALYSYFKSQADREPTDFDMYVLWNTRYGYYASKDFSPARLHPLVRDRAERFSNLVEDGSRQGPPLVMAGLR
jgi:hypothetical protein